MLRGCRWHRVEKADKSPGERSSNFRPPPRRRILFYEQIVDERDGIGGKKGGGWRVFLLQPREREKVRKRGEKNFVSILGETRSGHDEWSLKSHRVSFN